MEQPQPGSAISATAPRTSGAEPRATSPRVSAAVYVRQDDEAAALHATVDGAQLPEDAIDVEQVSGQCALVDGTCEADAGSDAGLGGPLRYTAALTTGSTILPRHSCPMPSGGGAGDNLSPPLEWTGGPAQTQSFAVVVVDEIDSTAHWALWNIPTTTTLLPEGVGAGFDVTDIFPTAARSRLRDAHQAADLGDDAHAYYGPCTSGPDASSYAYRLYALDTMLSLTEGTTASEAFAVIEAASLEAVSWSGAPE